MDKALQQELRREIARRRTFAIISHPDAGKTTLTEKLLLYSGMIRTAGMVGSRKSRKAASSDWMEMEQERGISITASAMQFQYKDVVINVLDTPGHQDFSEDTYRTLTAADSVIMVIDAAKGVEAQTRKLFEACRLRAIPVLTFINKMDMPSRDPIDLMDEVEEVLGIEASARNWPIGSGRDFQGVIDRDTREAHFYTRVSAGGSKMPEVLHVPIAEAAATGRLTEDQVEELVEDLELLDVAGNEFSREAYLNFKVTPVFFGSALTNFGVEPLFDAFVHLAPPPRQRPADQADGEEVTVDPGTADFSAYVFKMQANMDPRHRDCVAFMRINSGRYERNLQVVHSRLGRSVRLSRPHTLMAQGRETLEAAYPGDIIGVMNPGGLFTIGDTLLEKGNFTFKPLPKFQPELFARIRPSDFGKRKAIDKGLTQLVSEGAIQLLTDWHDTGNPPIVAAVGQLQFEVLQYRLKQEYKVGTSLNTMPYDCSAWLVGDVDTFKKPLNALLVRDDRDRPMVLFSNQWEKQYALRENPDHQLVDFM